MSLSQSAMKVQQKLNAFGLQLEVIELPDSTRTAQEAAQAIGCQVGQIAKSHHLPGSYKPQTYHGHRQWIQPC